MKVSLFMAKKFDSVGKKKIPHAAGLDLPCLLSTQ